MTSQWKASLYAVLLLASGLSVQAETIVITGATVLDGTGSAPLENGLVLIENDRVAAIGTVGNIAVPTGAREIKAAGKYIIPGLMDANVHLYLEIPLVSLVRYEGRYHEIITEAAQVALKSGVITVFDSWGPRQPLVKARDAINAGQAQGARIFLAGNIVGFDGPMSKDFIPAAATMADPAFVKRTNALWQENVGRELMWLTPEQVRKEVRAYAARGIDFLKYGASGHTEMAFITFSERVQKVMVEEAHRAGITVQTHTSSVESLHMAIEAGVDLLQHCDVSGPVEIPASTIKLLVERQVACATLPLTRKRLGIEEQGAIWVSTKNINNQNLIEAGVNILLSTDAGVMGDSTESFFQKNRDGDLTELGQGHFRWFEAVEEMGMKPMDMLMAATSNIAKAYKVDKDLGTLEVGKIADLLILDKNPLRAAKNYRSIHTVMKNGKIIDRAKLPDNPILSRE